MRQTGRTLGGIVLLSTALAAGARAQESDGTTLRVRPTAYLQLDARWFTNWEARVDDVDLARDGREIRRMRLGFEADLGRSWRVEADADPTDADQPVKDAFGEWRPSDRFRLRAGHFKLPFSEEQILSARRTPFVERSRSSEDLGPGRDLGLLAEVAIRGPFAYAVGAFAGDGLGGAQRAGITGVLRAEYRGAGRLRLGAGATLGLLEEDLDDTPVGTSGRAVSGYRFHVGPRAEGTRLRAALDGSWTAGDWRVQADAGLVRETRRGQGAAGEDLPPVLGRGGSLSVHWLAAGERRRRGGVRARPGLLRGPGAIELSLRAEALAFDDTGATDGVGLPGVRAADLRPASLRGITGGLSWWPIEGIRLVGNVSAERFGTAASAPEPGRAGRYLTVSARIQLELP